MWLLSLISFLLLGGYLLLAAMRFGIPDMVSDTFYQLQGCTGSEVVDDKHKGNYGFVFSLVMLAVAVMMMICLLDTGMGVQCLAFLGCAGLAFVAIAPNYVDKDELAVHKAGAIVAAVGCVGWCMSVCLWVTFVVLLAYVLYLTFACFYTMANGMWYISSKRVHFHPWYFAEAAGFIDVFVTYWVAL